MAGDAVLDTLRDAWTALQTFNAPVAVMGGLAPAAWEHVRATRDVDLLIGIEFSQAEELLRRLAGAGFRPKRKPPILTLGNRRLVQLLYQPPTKLLDLQVDLILNKLIAGRVLDRADCAALLAANRSALDQPYLLRWSQDLGVATELAEVWSAAFPGESFPAS